MNQIKLQAYGKINLSLDVLRQRPDGYHDVRMIMQTVKLHDNVDIERTEEPGIQLETNLPFLPVNEKNLMWRAAKLLSDEFQLRQGVRMRLKKVIPVAAGMAGGSSDAAAVLYGVNRLFRLGLSLEELQQRGVQLGADIPFCLLRGTALSEGIGEVLSPLPSLPHCHIVLAKPPISVSTKAVYEGLHVNELPAGAHPDVDAVMASLHAQDLHSVSQHMGNILETVTIRQHPEIAGIKQIMLELGACNAMMSGSGPTVFGIFDDAERARRCCQILQTPKKRRLTKQVYLTEPWHMRDSAAPHRKNR